MHALSPRPRRRSFRAAWRPRRETRRSGGKHSSVRPTMRPYPILLPGIAVIAAYLAAVAVMPPAPHARVLYDGLVPQPPYRWVRPPSGRQSDNEKPQPYATVLPLGAGGSVPAEFATDDLQATITFPADVVEPRAGETKARVTLTPLDPETLGPPPSGRRFDGNAYRIEAVYEASG